MNNDERQQWIENDEYLYNCKKFSRLSMTEFIRQNRAEIDEYISKAINKQPAAAHIFTEDILSGCHIASYGSANELDEWEVLHKNERIIK